MSLRDLVAADCAEPNPLARFMQGFSNDKVGMYQDQWVDQRDSTSEAGPSLTAFERLRMKEVQDREEGEVFRNMDRDAKYFDPLEDEALENSYRAAFSREGVEAREGALSNFLKSFVVGGMRKELMGRFGVPDMGFSGMDKAKIRGRAAVMSRHFYANESQDFVDEQMGILLDNLHIGPDERADLDAAWRQSTFDRRGPPPPPIMERERARGGAWADEFANERGNWANEFMGDRSGWAGEFASERSANRMRAHSMDEFEYHTRETLENNAWIEENSHHGPLISGSDAWADQYRSEGTRWAGEYLGKSDRELEDEAMDAAWKSITDDRKFEEAWNQSTGADYGRQKNLRDLTAAITQIDDPKLQASTFMQFMHKINKGQVSFADNKVIENDDADGDWASEYQGMSRQFANNDWAREYDDFKTIGGGDWAREYEGFTGAIVDPNKLQEYEFALNQTANPYSGQEGLFERGVELFNQGMITESILALEAEVYNNPQNSKAWQYLGQAHAENDKDTQAITCLNRAVEVDPQNLEALAALAVSYTNDFNREKALDVLETWMRRNPEYSSIPAGTRPPPAGENDFYMDAWARHTYVANMYLEAARQRPEDPDPEVQTALGLLYNLSYEYDKAVDCFQAALTKRPEDYLLWNKLGATLANSNRSEEALGAYYKALEGKPTYVRARANLGISFLALNEYPDAARSFLAALRLHPNAVHLWDNLKMVFRLMSRDDLEERAMNHNIEDFGEDYSTLF